MSGSTPGVPGDFPAGTRIASYRIEELVGRGGMAAVYRASDVRLGRQVALKVLASELARDDAFRQRFIRESRAGAAVDHPNVIPVFEAGEAAGVLFIAMRFVAGHDVRALIARAGRLPADRTVSIVSQIAGALDAAHAHGLVHRDVKPANMLLGTVSDGRRPDHVYLSDFGLSRQTVAASTLTRTGQFLGTVDYMSPEQIEGHPVDGRADLYSLACAAFEMLTGQPPFRRDRNLAVMWAQVSAAPPSVRSWRPDLSATVDEVLSRALAKSPADRPATCLEFAADLEAACAVASFPEQPGDDRAISRSGYRVPGPRSSGEGQAPPVRIGPETSYGSAFHLGAAAPYPAREAEQHASAQGSGHSSPAGPGRKILAAALITLVALGLAGGAFLVLRGRRLLASNLTTTTTSPSPPAPASPVATSGPASPGTSGTSPGQTSGGATTPPYPPGSPARVVTEYFAAINNRQYLKAWRLDWYQHARESYASFRQGFAGTQQDVAAITRVSGDVVTVSLTAEQTDGSAKYFTGSYTIRYGRIVYARIQQTGLPRGQPGQQLVHQTAGVTPLVPFPPGLRASQDSTGQNVNRRLNGDLLAQFAGRQPSAEHRPDRAPPRLHHRPQVPLHQPGIADAVAEPQPDLPDPSGIAVLDSHRL